MFASTRGKEAAYRTLPSSSDPHLHQCRANCYQHDTNVSVAISGA